MYPALWRILPGPTWLKVCQCLALLVAFVAVLLMWVFPWVEPHLPLDRIVITEE